MEFVELLKKHGFRREDSGSKNYPAVAKAAEEYISVNGTAYAADLIGESWQALGSSYVMAQNHFYSALWGSKVKRTNVGRALREIFEAQWVSCPKGYANRVLLYLKKSELKEFLKPRTQIRKTAVFRPK